MRRRLVAGKLFAVAALVSLVNLAAAGDAHACKCVPPNVESSYNNSSDVAIVDVARTFVLGSTRFYLVRAERVYKGCHRAGQWLLLKTPASSATCGATLDARRHLINADAAGRQFGLPALTINACSYNVPATTLTEHDRTFLNGRTVCCGDKCACADGTQPVLCFADPCTVAPNCDAGACVANYCGGCNAEFYDEGGNAVCQGGRRDCSAGEDCPKDQWCREAANPSDSDPPRMECVPFATEGESCNGFTVPWAYQRCAPGLTCDTPDLMVDASGICRRSCASHGDCTAGEYCASDKLCDKVGACERAIDCSMEGNSYPHIECAGHEVCDDSHQCGWVCENPQCLDLTGFDFGPCALVLGWAVLDGGCVEVSGCRAPFELFASGEECRKSCRMLECGPDANVCVLPRPTAR